MQVHHTMDEISSDAKVALTIGTFDGVHRGHQHLLCQLVRRARAQNWRSVVVTFHPHPRTVLQPQTSSAYLATVEKRQQALTELGVDLLILLPFTKALAHRTAREFVSDLESRLALGELWIGSDFAMGRDREGSIAQLQALGTDSGFGVHVVDQLMDKGHPISSTRIRNELQLGHVAEANRLLGYRYAVATQVIPGHQRGRKLGFRTANLRLDPERAIPANGVYAVWAHTGAERIPGVANLGVRPSFDLGERLLEVHLLGYEGDLYGSQLEIEFVEYLRPEMRFNDADSLVSQITQDAAHAQAILAANDSEGILSCQQTLKN